MFPRHSDCSGYSATQTVHDGGADGDYGSEIVSHARMITDLTTETLECGLDGVHTRQRTIAQNLANIETPGYRARSVQFEDQLAEAIEQQRPEASSPARPRLSVSFVRGFRDTPTRGDGNSVDIETETMEMAKSALHYRYLSRLLRKKLQMVRLAINGGSSP